jgi:putative intracellular protease/amidase
MRLGGKRVVVLVAEGFEDLEYWVTVMRLREEGAEVISVGPSLEPVSGKNFLEARADATAHDVDASELDGVVIPGGGAKYFPSAWVCVHMLRHLGCTLPVELWHLGPREVTEVPQ